MKRREFITLLGGAAAAWPLAARAQQAERDAAHRRAPARSRGRCGISGPRRGVPAGAAAIGLDRSAATCGSTLAGRRPMPTDIRRHAAELVALAPDVILAHGGSTVAAVAAGDPHRADRVPGRRPIRSAPASSTAWRGRAATPPVLCSFEYSMSGKWLELLKQIAPGVTRVAVLRDPTERSGIGQFGAIQAVAPSLGVEVSPINVRDAGEIERAVAAFARSSNGGLIVTASGSA